MAAGLTTFPHTPRASGTTLSILWLNSIAMLMALSWEARRRPYSLHLMHLLSLWLFLGVAAVYQYSGGHFPFAGIIDPLQRQIFVASLAVSLWLIGYVVAYETTHHLTRGGTGALTRLLGRHVTAPSSFWLLVLAILSLLYLAAIGLADTSTRAGADAAVRLHARQAGRGAAQFGLAYLLIHDMLLRALSPVAFLAGLLVLVANPRSRNPIFIGLVVAVGVGTLIANNPFAAARMWFATIVIAVLAPFVLIRLRTGWGLVGIALMGLAVLPALHLTRLMENFSQFTYFFELSSPVAYLRDSGDVDSLGLLTLVQKWTETHGHRFGLQIIGGLLFWVPRTFWPGKPISTGPMVTEDLGFDFTNLAVPIVSEPLVDFGLVGVLPVAVLWGFMLARIDRSYWDGASAVPAGPRLVDCLYPFWLGCIVFLTRGGWFSSLTFTVVFTVWLIPLGMRPSSRARAGYDRLSGGDTSGEMLRDRAFHG